MVMIRRVPREQMAANHAARRLTRVATVSRPVLANIPTLLDLGDTVYVEFRGRAFGVPPVAWRVGEKLLAARMDAMAAAGSGTLTKESAPAYYRALQKLARILWRHSFPVGRIWRFLKAVRVMRNPYRQATEAELVALTDFFLQRRMASGVGVSAIPQPSTMR